MELYKLNPFIRYARLHRMHKSYGEDSICYDCRLFYILKGEGSIRIGEASHPVLPGTSVFLPPATRYRIELSEPESARIYSLNFDLGSQNSHISASLGTAFESSFDPARVSRTEDIPELSSPIVGTVGSSIENSVAACVELFLSETANYKHLASAQLKTALIELLNCRQLEKGGYRLVRELEDYVRKNYRDPDLSNKTVAAAFSYHPYYLGRVMMRYTGMTLHGYIIDYRIRVAKNYLMTTELSVNEIAELVGFASYTYFIKTFRERVGISPMKYRRNHAVCGI